MHGFKFKAGSSRRGVTLLDVMVMSVIIVLFMGSVVPAQLFAARERANRIKCGSNLRQISQALMLYASCNKGAYPRVRYEPATRPTAYTHPLAGNSFAKDGPDANDVTAAMFMLARQADLNPEVLVCPSSDARRMELGDKSVVDFSNISDSTHLSYSFANPYPNAKAAEAGYKLNDSLPAGFAVTADMNPGGEAVTKVTATSPAEEMKKANSRNHRGEGQNVGYADGSVTWVTNCFVGVKQDNIFSYGPCDEKSGGTGVIGSPTGPDDSVLLPTAEQGAPTTRPATAASTRPIH